MSIGDERFGGSNRTVNTVVPSEHFYRFLRSGHVLRSLLREFLEEDFLHKIRPHRLTRSQFCFLKLIAAKSDLQVGELARALGVSPAASSKNLDTLEELGLVNRETSDQDRRVILLRASDEGRSLVQKYEDLKAAHLAPVIEALGPEKTEQLCDLLEEVCGAVLERAETPRQTCLRCAGYYFPDCAFEQFQGECAMRPRSGAGNDEVDA
jgi:DNA-binding MarR family transcriptional regulator